jgi:hypothetical protein
MIYYNCSEMRHLSMGTERWQRGYLAFWGFVHQDNSVRAECSACSSLPRWVPRKPGKWSTTEILEFKLAHQRRRAWCTRNLAIRPVHIHCRLCQGRDGGGIVNICNRMRNATVAERRQMSPFPMIFREIALRIWEEITL